MTDRTDALLRMLERRPDDTRLRFGLALEYLKLDRLDEAVTQLQAYLESADDEGNAWGRLGDALRRLGRHDEAVAAFRRGIEVAEAHGHPTMAEEFRRELDEQE
ncbi:MAG: tetratricopeptide repeat protein [Gemmatimonadetes bacterium]|mgnify:CR=1 FL=1|nr:tetratricopeptide repeat protein [Gemmatimonadota bacterium]MBT8405296.1 tetratricopeptide repeat protein [Gemmatimonadota bacterium]NNK64330.1 tetratricopeptide repeat protein [Gemmatimonadota bacterium]